MCISYASSSPTDCNKDISVCVASAFLLSLNVFSEDISVCVYTAFLFVPMSEVRISVYVYICMCMFLWLVLFFLS